MTVGVLFFDPNRLKSVERGGVDEDDFEFIEFESLRDDFSLFLATLGIGWDEFEREAAAGSDEVLGLRGTTMVTVKGQVDFRIVALTVNDVVR